MKKTLALCFIGMLTLSLISIPSAKADFTISFNVSCQTVSPTNCQDITISVGTTADSTPFRAFQGDASVTGWLKTGAFPVWNNLAVQPNGTFGGFIMTIEGGTVSSQPLSLQFKSEDIDMLFLNDISSSGSIDYDPWIVPITHSNNASPPKFTLQYSTFARIQNPSEITAMSQNYTLSIEHRVRFLDGISGISGGDQTIAFSNYTFTNSNKGNSMLQSFVSDTTTLTTSTKEFIRLNAVFYDRVRGELNGNMTLVTGKYPRIEYQTFYDDINFQNGWSKGDLINLSACAGTFESPCESGQIDLLLDFNPRTRWHFDFPQDFPNAEINPDGYEGWITLDNRTYTESCGVSPPCTNTFTVQRTTAIAEPSFPSGFTPKSIQMKLVAQGSGATGGGTERRECGIGTSAQNTNATGTFFTMTERLFPTESENVAFVLFHKLFVTSAEDTTCNFNAEISVRLTDPDGLIHATATIFNQNLNVNSATPISQGWFIKITQPSALSNNFQFMDVQVRVRFHSFTSTDAETCTGDTCIVSYSFFMDSYASNWLVLVDQNGDQCDIGDECKQVPTSTCNEFGYTTDPVEARNTGKCLIPTGEQFCDSNPTDPLCTNIDTPTAPSGTTIGEGENAIAVDCGTGTLDFSPIDFTNTELATNSVTNLLTNIGILMGCAPTLWIPLITLLGGIGGIATFVSKDVAIHGIFAFIMVWAFFFAVVGFIPFWMALVTAMGIIGLWVLIGKRTLTTTAGG